MRWDRKEHSSSGKKAARKARGERTLCPCGVVTFVNHVSDHMKGGKHQARLERKAQDKAAIAEAIAARRQRKKRVAQQYAEQQEYN